jgi:hypothetical protein
MLTGKGRGRLNIMQEFLPASEMPNEVVRVIGIFYASRRITSLDLIGFVLNKTDTVWGTQCGMLSCDVLSLMIMGHFYNEQFSIKNQENAMHTILWAVNIYLKKRHFVSL